MQRIMYISGYDKPLCSCGTEHRHESGRTLAGARVKAFAALARKLLHLWVDLSWLPAFSCGRRRAAGIYLYLEGGMKTSSFLLFPFLTLALTLSLPVLAADASAAVSALLVEAKTHFSQGKNEQAAALLERALRIQPGNPILWHNLAGVRLQQEEWAKAASLAAKANSLAVNDRWLRIRNWTVIALACDGMGNAGCMREARSRAQTLAAAE